MRIERLKASELDETVRSAWRRAQGWHPIFANPYYAPEFTEAVARVRPDVYVAVIEDRGTIAGVFPFEADARGRGKPVGSPLTDYQGLIAAPDLPLDLDQLLRGCGLYRWDFDHVPSFQSVFGAHARERAISPGIRLEQGFDAYVAEKNASGSDVIRQARRRRRQIGKNVGEVRFEPDCTAVEMLDLVIEWKSAQYRRSGIRDGFAVSWTRELLVSILRQRSPGFSGVLSVLYAGDRPVALHMGMRSETVLHWWFPVYDLSCRKYSPGAVLLLELLEHAAATGATLVDLGRDEDPYKQRFKNSEVELMLGSAHLPGLRYGIDCIGALAVETLRKAPMPRSLRDAARRIRQRADARRLQ